MQPTYLTRWAYGTLTFVLCLAVVDKSFQEGGGGGASVKLLTVFDMNSIICNRRIDSHTHMMGLCMYSD